MSRLPEPTPADDATSLFAIAAGSMVSLLGMGGAIVVFTGPDGTGAPPLVVAPTAVESEVFAPTPVRPAGGGDRIAGSVVLTDGTVIGGYLRWNGREASWADQLPATVREGAALAGVRFGHLARVERVSGGALMAVSKDGRALLVDPGGTAGLTQRESRTTVEVEVGDGSVRRVDWPEIDVVHFRSDSEGRAPVAERIHGTVTVSGGRAFTGYVLWNGGEGLLSDLIGDEVASGRDLVRFADARRISRPTPDRLTVERAGGSIVDLRSEELVDGPGEVTVADPSLGVVVVPWSDFRSLEIEARDVPVGYGSFDGGQSLAGSVQTQDGRTFDGAIVWDADEHRTTQTLDGVDGPIRYSIEFGLIAGIEKHRQGARVTLRDGRRVYVSGTNDVNWANRGIEVVGHHGTRTFSWHDFVRARFDLRGTPGP